MAVKQIAVSGGPSEREIVHAIRSLLGTDPRVVLWVNPVGHAETDKRHIAYGLAVGSSDLVGIATMPSGVGRFFALEVKTATGRVRPEQTQWIELVRKRGGFATVVRSAIDAHAALERCLAGASA